MHTIRIAVGRRHLPHHVWHDDLSRDLGARERQHRRGDADP